jgi:hypothetical protein
MSVINRPYSNYWQWNYWKVLKYMPKSARILRFSLFIYIYFHKNNSRFMIYIENWIYRHVICIFLTKNFYVQLGPYLTIFAFFITFFNKYNIKFVIFIKNYVDWYINWDKSPQKKCLKFFVCGNGETANFKRLQRTSRDFPHFTWLHGWSLSVSLLLFIRFNFHKLHLNKYAMWKPRRMQCILHYPLIYVKYTELFRAKYKEYLSI